MGRVLRAVAVLSAGLLAGCAGAGDGPITGVCPAIGWSNLLRVEVEGDTSQVTQVQLCDEGGCWPEEGVSADPTSMTYFSVTRSGDVWSFGSMGTPDPVTILVTARDGTVLAETEADLEWVRVGGTEECGGPHEAAVTVEV